MPKKKSLLEKKVNRLVKKVKDPFNIFGSFLSDIDNSIQYIDKSLTLKKPKKNNMKISKQDVEKVKTYWQQRYDELPNYIVVGQDGDNCTSYSVIHKKDEKQYRSGCYSSQIIIGGYSLSKSEMQKVADKLNKLK